MGLVINPGVKVACNIMQNKLNHLDGQKVWLLPWAEKISWQMMPRVICFRGNAKSSKRLKTWARGMTTTVTLSV